MSSEPSLTRALALYDFDGTITRGDTLIALIKFSRGGISFYWGLIRLLPTILRYLMGKKTSQEMKEAFLAYFFHSITRTDFDRVCERFCHTVLPDMIKKEALASIEAHQKTNTRIVIVSASVENWIRPWCIPIQADCLATRMEFKEECFTGRFRGANCNGFEKVNRIHEALALETYFPIYAYGNSTGDLPMLSLANYPFYKTFETQAKQ